jgi:glucosyl-3-phosphoglycerate synthase
MGTEPGLRRFHHAQFDAEKLARTKGRTVVSVCLSARDEEATVGGIVAVIRTELVERAHLVDEIVVVDDLSTDATAAVASRAGAIVVPAHHPPPEGAGKGAAMATALAVSKGDVVAFLDADVVDFAAHFVVGLLGPLLSDSTVGFVKATYRRPLAGVVDEGGRVTELAARPLLDALFPKLAQFGQPLAGECAARRDAIEPVPLDADYGVDVALLIDIARRLGVRSLAEVDLGERVHRNRPLIELAPQARSVVRAILTRAGVPVASPASSLPADADLRRGEPETAQLSSDHDRRGQGCLPPRNVPALAPSTESKITRSATMVVTPEQESS